MKRNLLFLAAIFATSLTVHSQEALVNGDFETGVQSPWITEAGSVLVQKSNTLLNGGSFSAVLSTPSTGFGMSGTARMVQTVGTEPGASYLLVGEAGSAIVSVTLSAGAAGSGSADVTIPLTLGNLSDAAIFTASSLNTQVAATVTSSLGIVQVAFDNLSLFKLTSPNSLAGKYAGTATTSLRNEDASLSQKNVQPVVARINSDSTIVILQNGVRAHGGVIADDGTFFLRIGNQSAKRGRATIKGDTIKIVIPDLCLEQATFDNALADELAAPTFTIKLKRTGS